MNCSMIVVISFAVFFAVVSGGIIRKHDQFNAQSNLVSATGPKNLTSKVIQTDMSDEQVARFKSVIDTNFDYSFDHFNEIESAIKNEFGENNGYAVYMAMQELYSSHNHEEGSLLHLEIPDGNGSQIILYQHHCTNASQNIHLIGDDNDWKHNVSSSEDIKKIIDLNWWIRDGNKAETVSDVQMDLVHKYGGQWNVVMHRLDVEYWTMAYIRSQDFHTFLFPESEENKILIYRTPDIWEAIFIRFS